MKHYPILMLFLLFGITVSAQQQKKVNVDIKSTTSAEKLNYPDFDIDTLTRPEVPITFQKPVDFAGSTFLQFADWADVTFLDSAAFTAATFSRDVAFTRTKFFKYTSFWTTAFSGKALFDRTVFAGFSDFKQATFSDTISFNLATISMYIDFVQANFSRGVRFDYVTLSGLAEFSAAVFKGRSCLSLTHLLLEDGSNLRFIDTVLPDTILFSDNSLIKNEIDFTHADFTAKSRYDYTLKQPKPILIYLYNSDIAKLRLDYIHFKLLLPDSTVVTDEPKTFISPDETASVYESLLNNFKTNGQTESYELLDIEYQQFKWKHSWTHWIPCIPKYWWNFGYDKEYIFGWTFLLLFVFTCFSFIYIYSLNTKVYAMEKIPTTPDWQKKLSLRDFWNRLWYSFMYTSTVFFMLSLKIENVQFKEKRGTFYLVTVYSVGLICIAYVANFILQK